MEATCSSETSVDFQRTTRRYVPEDRTLQYFTLSNELNEINFLEHSPYGEASSR
jgi:hypothetical protein